MSRSTAYEREPCPVRILGDVGGGFGIGIIGGTIWHAVKGSRASPKSGTVFEESDAIKTAVRSE